MQSTSKPDDLLWELRSSRSSTRRAALRSLADSPHPELFDAVLAAMEGDGDARVREAAAHALARYGDPRAVPALVGAVLRGRSDAYAAARALGTLGEPAARAVCEALERPAASWIEWSVQGLRGLLQIDERTEAQSRTRKLLTNVLRTLREPATVPALRTLAHDPHAGVWYTALQALQRIGTEEARAAMRDALARGRPESRSAAVRALARLRDRQAVPHIVPLLAHSSIALRREAGDALVSILAPGARHLVRDFRAFVVGGGALVTRQEAIPLLSVLVETAPPGVRFRAAESLDALARRRPCRALLEALPALRKCAAGEEDPERREFYRAVLHRVEASTARFILPVPSTQSLPSGEDLPGPSNAPESPEGEEAARAFPEGPLP